MTRLRRILERARPTQQAAPRVARQIAIKCRSRERNARIVFLKCNGRSHFNPKYRWAGMPSETTMVSSEKRLPGQKASISLCMIVRNEEAHLEDCFRSAAGLTREII